MTQYESIFSAASQLSVDDRLRLIDELAATVPEEQLISPEWITEIERRSDEITNGAVETIPWEQVQSELKKRIGK